MSSKLLPVATALLAAAAIGVPAAQAQAPVVRLAAPADCVTNPGCGLGLQRTYGLAIRSVFSPLVDADSGIAALDDGVAQVAVVFSANPEASRADLVKLRDDRRMLGPENVVPSIATRTLDRFSPAAARRLRRVAAEIASELGLADLRNLNQLRLDGRLAEPIAGEWAEGHGFADADAPAVTGPRLVFGYEAFDESEILTRLYALALEGQGFRTAVRPVKGFRKEAYRALTKGAITAHVDFATSALRFLKPSSRSTSPAAVRRELTAAGAERGVTFLAFARAADSNTFVTKRSTSDALGVRTLSDLAKYWPKAAAT